MHVIETLVESIDYWYCATLSGERGLSGEELADKINNLIPKDKDGLPKVEVFESPRLAYEAAKERSQLEDRIVVFGSFLQLQMFWNICNHRINLEDYKKYGIIRFR
ncbi:hypothetical protein OURE66S_00959 [Oligella ureolytica]